MTELAALGWSDFFAKARDASAHRDAVVARIARVDRGMATALSDDGEIRLTFTRRFGHENGIVVGDWVLTEDSRIVELLPRRTHLQRRAAGESLRSQSVVANVDVIAVVMSLGADIRASKLERFVTLAQSSDADVVVLLTKSDIEPDPVTTAGEIAALVPGMRVLTVSARTGDGVDAIRALVPAGTTLAFVGPSGVGKSTLTNVLTSSSAAESMDIGDVRRDGKGRHTTTHRQLIPLPTGGILIDTPGLREAGLWAAEDALEDTFDDLLELAATCRFSDCTHDAEPGCAIRAAAADDPAILERLAAMEKLEAEQAELTVRNVAHAENQARSSRRRARERAIKGDAGADEPQDGTDAPDAAPDDGVEDGGEA